MLIVWRFISKKSYNTLPKPFIIFIFKTIQLLTPHLRPLRKLIHSFLNFDVYEKTIHIQ